jgi:parallel beta-helix repeat protein
MKMKINKIVLILLLFCWVTYSTVGIEDVFLTKETVSFPGDENIIDEGCHLGDTIEIGEDFTLEQDYENTCFKIVPNGDDEIIIDCDEHIISGMGPNDNQVAFWVAGADHVTIKDCNIQNIQYGIIFHDSDYSTALNNDIKNTMYPNFWGPVDQSYVRDNTAENNNIDTFIMSGIWMLVTRDSVIKSNDLDDGYISIYTAGCRRCDIERNSVNDAEITGIGINGSTEINVYKNEVDHAGTSDLYGDGIGLLNSEKCKVYDNTITNTYSSGIAVLATEAMDDCEVYDNSISDAGTCGIWFGMDDIFAYDNTIEDCNYGLCFSDITSDFLEGCISENDAIQSSDSKDVYVYTDDISRSNILRNLDFDEDEVDCDSGVDDSSLTIQEYVTIKVVDYNEDPIENVEVDLENGNSETIMDDEITDSAGETDTVITTRGVYLFDDGDTDYDNYEEHKSDLTYGGQDYEGNIDIDKSGTFIIKLSDIVLHYKGATGDPCETGLDCSSGYCCGRGVYKDTCRESSAQCPNYECINDDHCNDDEICVSHDCEKLTGACGYAENHQWIDYECCEDDECASDEKCDNHECVNITGTCGYIDNHQWVDYDCCADNDCEDDERCDNHSCVKVTGTNGFAANHTWIQYECDNNSDCNSDEFCDNHFCKQITQGTCGEISNHQWVDYECCDDSECEDGKVCRDNKCQEKGLCGFLSILLLTTGALGLYSFRKP